ncbi:hypothetical protein [Azospirillum lipoferum]|nr:hypothetical protein [Azospirillum lipoferum]
MRRVSTKTAALVATPSPAPVAQIAPPAAPPTLADDLLQGADSIAKFMGVTRRQAYHFVADGRIPTFRIGAIICARKSTILNWIAQQEAAQGGGGTL